MSTKKEILKELKAVKSISDVTILSADDPYWKV